MPSTSPDIRQASEELGLELEEDDLEGLDIHDFPTGQAAMG